MMYKSSNPGVLDLPEINTISIQKLRSLLIDIEPVCWKLLLGRGALPASLSVRAAPHLVLRWTRGPS